MKSDLDFSIPYPPPPNPHQIFSSATTLHHHNPPKKRSKLIRINSPPAAITSKPKNVKKPDPCAPKITPPCSPKITPPCSECGRRFWSYKALFGHMRCHPERQWRGINPPPKFQRLIKYSNNVDMNITDDDSEIASCLLMLANSLPLESDNYNFECTSCKRVFGSHQALGGHRASHKNIKGCFAITKSDNNEIDEHEISTMEGCLEGLHKCSICLRMFSSGQALGGHKRCHWDKLDEPNINSVSQGFNSFGSGMDLNMPATTLEVDSCFSYLSSGFTLDLRLGL